MKTTLFMTNLIVLVFLCIMAQPAISYVPGAVDAGVVSKQLSNQAHYRQMQHKYKHQPPAVIYKKHPQYNSY